MEGSRDNFQEELEDLDEPLFTLTKRDFYNLLTVAAVIAIAAILWYATSRWILKQKRGERNREQDVRRQKVKSNDTNKQKTQKNKLVYPKDGLISTYSEDSAEEGGMKHHQAEPKDSSNRDYGKDLPNNEQDGEPAVIVSILPLATNPPSRLGPAFCLDQESSALYLYSGIGETSALSDLHIFDIANLRWKKQKITPENEEDWPGQRAHTAAICAQGLIFIFGGQTLGAQIKGDLVFYHPPDKMWVHLTEDEDENCPEPRKHATMCLWKDQHLVLFGGKGFDHLFDDVWLFDIFQIMDKDLGQMCWQRLTDPSQTQSAGANSVMGSGGFYSGGSPHKSSAREGHCAAVVNDLMYVFGGQKNGKTGIVPKGSIEVLNLNTGEWFLESTAGTIPMLGAFEKCHAVGPDASKIIHIADVNAGIFNQMSVLDTGVRPMEWSLLKLTWVGDWTMVPGKRSMFASVAEPTTGTIFVFGGESEVGIMYDSLIILETADALGIELEFEDMNEEGDVGEDNNQNSEGFETNTDNNKTYSTTKGLEESIDVPPFNL